MTAEFSNEVKQADIARAGGYCEKCGYPITRGDFHHRMPRKMGGTKRELNTVGNCLYVHSKCHQYIHLNPAESYEHGWLLHEWEEVPK